MSNIERANQWIALLTNVGVLLGLFFLIYEIRQNTISIENQTDVAIIEMGSSQAGRNQPQRAGVASPLWSRRGLEFLGRPLLIVSSCRRGSFNETVAI